MTQSTTFDLTVIGILVLNVVSAVGIVMSNKQVVAYNYKAIVFLSALHMIFTYGGLDVMMRMGVFGFKDANLKSVLVMSFGTIISIIFMNLSLAYNSVGFYQLSKLAAIPLTVTVQYLAFGTTISWRVVVTLIFISLGIGIATITDISFNVLGTVYATIGVVSTALVQVFFEPFRKEIDCDPLQTLYHTSPWIASGTLLCSPLFGEIPTIRNAAYHIPLILAILLSCIMAILVNASNYAVLSRISPLSYTILGHFKTVSILGLGAILFDATPSWKMIGGASMALGGVVFYSELRRRGL